MKLVTFRRSGEAYSVARAGVLLPYGVVDLQAAAPLATRFAASRESRKKSFDDAR